MEELELEVWFEENACSVRMLAVLIYDFELCGWCIRPPEVEELQLVYAKRSRPWGQYEDAALALL